MWSLFRMFYGLFGFLRAQRRGRENREEFQQDVNLQRARGADAKQALSYLEKELRSAEREAKGE